MVGLWTLSPWPTARPCRWTLLLLCCAVTLPLCTWEEEEAGKQEWSGPFQSLFQSQGPYLLHPCLTLATYILYYAPPFFYKKPKHKVENDRPDITEPIRAYGLSPGSSSPPHDSGYPKALLWSLSPDEDFSLEHLGM